MPGQNAAIATAPDGREPRTPKRPAAARQPISHSALQRYHVTFVALIVSATYAWSIFDWRFILGTSAYWNHLQLWDLDRAQALIGWRHFAREPWHLPLFSVASLGYPEGANIIFTDSIPLVAFVFKLLFAVTGLDLN